MYPLTEERRYIPAEIQAIIVSEITEKRYLANFARASKYLCSVARLHLYRKIVWNFPDTDDESGEDESLATSPHPMCVQLFILLRTCMLVPSLAAMTEEIRFTGIVPQRIWERKGFFEIAARVAENNELVMIDMFNAPPGSIWWPEFTQRLRLYPVEAKDLIRMFYAANIYTAWLTAADRRLFTDFIHGSGNAVITFILNETRNVRRLDLGPACFQPNLGFYLLFMGSSGPPSMGRECPFRHLTVVNMLPQGKAIGWYLVKPRTSWDMVSAVLAYSSVETLRATMLDYEESRGSNGVMQLRHVARYRHTLNNPFEHERPISRNLKRLALVLCELSPLTLGQLLGACPNIKALEYRRLLDLKVEFVSWHNFSVDELRVMLLPVKDTLEDLRISFHMFDSREGILTSGQTSQIAWGSQRPPLIGGWNIINRQRGFRFMDRLNHLEVPWSMMLADPVEPLQSRLPLSLKSLTLRSDESFAKWDLGSQLTAIRKFDMDCFVLGLGLKRLEIINPRFRFQTRKFALAFERGCHDILMQGTFWKVRLILRRVGEDEELQSFCV